MDNLDVLLLFAPSPQASTMITYRLQGLPPLGLGYIASYIGQFGYSAKILDLSISTVDMNHVFRVMEEEKPVLIGISTTTETYKMGICMAQLIKKKNPSQIVYMGGSHVTYEDKAAIETGALDFVIRHEGEVVSKNICDFFIKGIGKFENIKGITFAKNGVIYKNEAEPFIENLDVLPYPNRKLFQMDQYTNPSHMSTSRGCPGKCIFCAASGLSGGRYRMRSPESIIGEFKYLKSLGYNHVDIIDDTMTASIKRLDQFLDLMIQENLDMTWYCESRVDIMTKEMLAKMKKAGLKTIQFGVEAGSQQMLDCLKKNVTMEQIRNVFQWANDLNISTASCLIIGQPFDTQDTVRDTINFAKELRHLGARVVFSICTPFPGTYIWDHVKELGLEMVNDDLDMYTTYYPVYNSKNLTAKEIQNLFFSAFYELGSTELTPNLKKYMEDIQSKRKGIINKNNTTQEEMTL